jgi:hypothetical protein
LIIILVTDEQYADEPVVTAPVVVQDDETNDSVNWRRKRSSFLVIIHYTDNIHSDLPETCSLLNKGASPLSRPPLKPSGSASNVKKKQKGKDKLVFDGILVSPPMSHVPIDNEYDGDTDMGM